MRDLCTEEQVEYKKLCNGKKKRRSESEIFNHLKSIYDEIENRIVLMQSKFYLPRKAGKNSH